MAVASARHGETHAMKIITLIAMLAISLIVFLGLIPQGSVGGAMSFMLLFLIAALIVGIYDAWSARRGVLGWIVSLVVALIGGLIGAAAGAFALEMAMPLLASMGSLSGSLMQTGGPLLYLSINAQMLFTLLGAWLALGLVNKLR
jgi:hypothetical protein